MKNENVIKKFISYELTDLKALEENFTEMAAEGWYIRSIRSGIFEYEKKEPAKLRYCVEIVPTADRNTNRINQKTAEYIELCRQSGWEFVCNSAEVYVFVSPDESIPVITTDGDEKLKLIKKSVRIRNALLWLIAVLNGLSVSTHFLNYENERLMPFWIFAAVFWVSYAVILIIKSISFHRWYKNAVGNIDSGNQIEYNGKEVLKKRKKFFYGYLAFICVLLIVMAVWCMMNGLTAFAITILVEIAVVTAVIVPLVIILNKSDLSVAAMVIITLTVVMLLITVMVFPILLLGI